MFMPPRSVFVPRLRLSRLDEELLDLLSPRERAEVVAMLPFPTPMLLGASAFVGYSTTYTTVGSQSVPIPAGASQAVIDGYGAGTKGRSTSDPYYIGGGGGNFARKTVSVAGLTALYLTIPAGGSTTNTAASAAVARANTSSGTVLMQAGGGVPSGTAAANVGDLTYNGGAGYGTNTGGGGGGCAGPNGAGGNGGVTNGGAGGGGLAGAGGGATSTAGTPGSVYGGGGGTGGGPAFTNGAQGAIKITWS